MYERFAPQGIEVVYVGAFESEEACRIWKEEYELPFPVVSDDADNTLFRTYTNGWVPWSVLVAPDGTVIFSENEFDEAGFSAAIKQMYRNPGEQLAVRSAKEAVRRSDDQPAKIVILGGGTGGIVVAHEVRRRLAKRHSVVLVNRSSSYIFEPSLLWKIIGQRKDEQFHRSLDALKDKGIQFHEGSIDALDLDEQVVHTSSGTLEYDYLAIALGAHLVPETVPGFDEMALNLYTPEGCTQIEKALSEFEGGSIAVLVTAMPFKCPAAPYETAFLVDSLMRKKGIRDKTEIYLFTPEHLPMPVAPDKVGERLVGLLEKRGINYHPLYTFKELRPETREVVSSDGDVTRVDLLIGIPPHQAPDVIRESPLLGVSGFIHVDPNTLRTPYHGVYALGDVATIKLPNGKALPKAGVFAHGQAQIVAKNIIAEVRGKKPKARYEGHGYCWVELGDGKASFAGGNFFDEAGPRIRIVPPMRMAHWGKVAFEKWWLRKWF